MDFALIGLGALFFVISLGLVRFCGGLKAEE